MLSLCLLLLVATSALAQTFSVVPNDSMESTIAVNRVADQYIYFENNSSGPIVYQWTITTQTFDSQWIVQMCDNKVCRNLPFAGTNMAPVMPGDSGFLHLIAIPNNVPGDLLVIVSVSDSLHPSDAVDVTFIVHAGTSTAIDPVKLREQLTISPNPATDHLQLRARSGNLQKGNAKLYDLRGRIVLTQPIAAQQSTSLDLKALEPGIYLLRYETKMGTVTEKVVITH
jgi:Secretion system C-terminal sorting domain